MHFKQNNFKATPKKIFGHVTVPSNPLEQCCSTGVLWHQYFFENLISGVTYPHCVPWHKKRLATALEF